MFRVGGRLQMCIQDTVLDHGVPAIRLAFVDGLGKFQLLSRFSKFSQLLLQNGEPGTEKDRSRKNLNGFLQS